MIGIIDYDAGNLKSVEKALLHLGQETVVSRDRETLLHADKVILPGVGSFGAAMENLEKYGLVELILRSWKTIRLSLASAWDCSFSLKKARKVRA